MSYRVGIVEQLIRSKNRSSIDPPGIKDLSRRQELSRSIHQVLRICRESDKKQLKNLDKQQGVEEVSRRCRATFKNQFFKSEKYKHECNPTCNSTNDPINTIIFQNHLSIKILSIWISKNTHTHTKQV